MKINTLFAHYKESYRKMFDFKGRANRTQYWSCFLMNLLIVFVIFFIELFWLSTIAFMAVGATYQKDIVGDKVPSLITMTIGITLFSFMVIWGFSRMIPQISRRTSFT